MVGGSSAGKEPGKEQAKPPLKPPIQPPIARHRPVPKDPEAHFQMVSHSPELALGLRYSILRKTESDPDLVAGMSVCFTSASPDSVFRRML